MPTKEQELTFQNISEFFQNAEDLLKVMSDNVAEIPENDILIRLNVIEKFIDEAVTSADILAHDYTKLVGYKGQDEEKLKEDIKEQIVNMITSLNDCKEGLLDKVQK